MRTIFICILLGVGSFFFNRDAEKLVLHPIERMLEKVDMIKKNPMAAVNGKLDDGIVAFTTKKSKVGNSTLK